jgi:hypothetical protein
MLRVASSLLIIRRASARQTRGGAREGIGEGSPVWKNGSFALDLWVALPQQAHLQPLSQQLQQCSNSNSSQSSDSSSSYNSSCSFFCKQLQPQPQHQPLQQQQLQEQSQQLQQQQKHLLQRVRRMQHPRRK